MHLERLVHRHSEGAPCWVRVFFALRFPLVGLLRKMLYKREKLKSLTALCQRARPQRGEKHSVRSLGRKVVRVRKQVVKAKQQRDRHIRHRFHQKAKEQRAWQWEWRLSTWNTRGLGAFSGYINQELKIECFLTRMAVQRWGLVTLTDLSFQEDGVKTYRCRGSTWYLMVRQKVGFRMSEV